jgi:hypothetical protein
LAGHAVGGAEVTGSENEIVRDYMVSELEKIASELGCELKDLPGALDAAMMEA